MSNKTCSWSIGDCDYGVSTIVLPFSFWILEVPFSLQKFFVKKSNKKFDVPLTNSMSKSKTYNMAFILKQYLINIFVILLLQIYNQFVIEIFHLKDHLEIWILLEQ